MALARYNKTDVIAGLSYERWTIRWWQWLLSSSPPDFLTGFTIDPQVNFIGGTYEQDAVSPGPIRSAGSSAQPIPIAKSTLAAISVSNISAFEHPNQLAALPAPSIVDDVHEIMDGDFANNRPVAGTFTLQDPNGNVTSLGTGNPLPSQGINDFDRIEPVNLDNIGFAAGIVQGQPANPNVPCATSGYWIFLKPFNQPGPYTITITGMAPRYGTTNQIFQTAATYHLIVG